MLFKPTLYLNTISKLASIFITFAKCKATKFTECIKYAKKNFTAKWPQLANCA